MKNKKYQAIVFDMDHTLFDRYNTWRSIAYLMKARCKWLNPDLCAAEIGDLLVKADKLYIYQGWRIMFAHLIEWGMFSNPPSFEDYYDACIHLFREVVVPFPLLNEVLTDLRKQGYKLGIITNGNPETQKPKIEMLHFAEVMDEIIIGGDYILQKPHHEIFEEMARRLGCLPANMLYVGDHPRNDVEASRNAGYTPIWVKTTMQDWNFEQKPAPYEIHDVLELPELLKTINNQ